jgi:uncharacterized membrane protein
MWSPYKRRLLRDVDRWRSQGLLSDEARAAITADIESRGREFNLPAALGVLASVLFGFAAISFVAAHWEDVPRLARLALLLACLWTGYGLAGRLQISGHALLADAAVLFSSAMFGASIMLISQMYHIGGNAADGVRLWWLGALIAGVALRSNPTLALTMILVCVWSFLISSESNDVHWPFLIGWGLVTIAFVWQRWWPGLHLSALALSLFIVSLGFLAGSGHSHGGVAGVGILAALAAGALEKIRPDFDHIAAPAFAYAVAVAFEGLFVLQFFESPTLSYLVFLAVVTLALLVAVIAYAIAQGNRGALWIAYIAFSIEVLALYGVTVGSILGTSLFFLVAAVIVGALAYAALRLARRSQSGALPA